MAGSPEPTAKQTATVITHSPAPREEPWQCSPKQRNLILQIVDENHIDKNVVEQFATDRFGKGVKLLNKLEASGLIEELFEKYPRQHRNGRSTAPAR